MRFTSDSFSDGSRMRDEYTFLKPHLSHHAELSRNRNPHFAWGEMPEGTKSLVIVMHDIDAPTSRDFVNKAGKVVPYDYPRTEFYHWAAVDLDTKTFIQQGEFSKEVTVRGKPGPAGSRGTRHAVNDFTEWYKGNPNMEGIYSGYDGPAPPWNDEKLHTYLFTLYALKEKRCPVEGNFTCKDVVNALTGLVLEKATLKCTYAIYSKARP
ncbi:MAG TPA: YbhB/YbcL family Raf kinase inhibitor-like protein [bacterium]|jgi:Raf kinase inhibitor-like YbhB/YbcL family protein|nr:YbhB/YbcL family Raf kinase inhibitor-like protein [bacterium]